ncbi:hypothetical protein DL98DRAFT_591057 [Cadophora sp. DSE1049]|nr:hypothetical protein DL98DRAFT_591057 [Cadophora sp. DSE1049]
MTLSNYNEEKLQTKHTVELLEYHPKVTLTKLGAHDDDPDFEHFLVTAEGFTANIGYNAQSQILALDHLKNDKLQPGARLVDLIKEFCNRREMSPKILVITNVVEERTGHQLRRIKTDGFSEGAHPSFRIIMSTPLGKIAGGFGKVSWIGGRETGMDTAGQNILGGPNCSFHLFRALRTYQKA